MPESKARGVAWRRPNHDLDDQRLSVPYSWRTWGMIYAHRWRYTPPWGCTRWALPCVKLFRGGDEYCNDTLLLQLPFLGHMIFWKPWGTLRTTPCDECVADGWASNDA
jgi:hypothetical protein